MDFQRVLVADNRSFAPSIVWDAIAGKWRVWFNSGGRRLRRLRQVLSQRIGRWVDVEHAADSGAGKRLGVELGAPGTELRGRTMLADAKEEAWTEADIGLGPAARALAVEFRTKPGKNAATMVRDVVFRLPAGAELLVDDVLLYEPGSDKADGRGAAEEKDGRRKLPH
jgi:hypothetical protein